MENYLQKIIKGLALLSVALDRNFKLALIHLQMVFF